MISPFPATNTT